jgi:predicted AAA+ superfamily ATPase
MTKSTKEKDMTDKKSTIWQEELRKWRELADACPVRPTEDHVKEVEQDDRIIQFDAGEEVKYVNHEIEPTDFVKPRPREEVELLEGNMGEGKAEVVKAIARAEEEIEFIKSLPDLLEEDKRSDRFFGMRLKGKSIDDIENTFLAMFAEFVSLMALFIGMLGFGILLWAIFS